MEIDLNTLIEQAVKDAIKPSKVWDDYVPIVIEDNGTHIYLSDGIEMPSTYNEVCHLLSKATGTDTIHFHVNNPGGYICSAAMLYHAIQTTKATTIAHLSGDVVSAATVIAMACNDLVIAPFTQFMIHNYSGGVNGKGKEAKDQMEFVNNEINESFRTYYAGFLTEEEITDVINDHDIWLNSHQVLERWQNRYKDQ